MRPHQLGASMTLTLSAARADLAALDAPLLVVALADGADARRSDSPPSTRATGGALGRALTRRDFRGGRDETLHLAGGERGVQRVLLVGMGPARIARRRCAAPARSPRAGATRLGVGRLAFFAGALNARRSRSGGPRTDRSARGTSRRLKTAPPADEQRAPLDEATILVADADAAHDAALASRPRDRRRHSLARALGMLPGNVCTPDYLADTARDIAKRHGMTDHGARPRGDGSARRWARFLVRRAGHAAGAEAHRARVSQGREGRQAGRARRQGPLLRLRRHLDQAGAGHGVDEVRHVRRGRRARRDGSDRAHGTSDQRRGSHRLDDEHAVGRRR